MVARTRHTFAVVIVAAFLVPQAVNATEGRLDSTGAPALALSAASGETGTKVSITGSGFPPGEIVALYIDSPNPYIGSTPPGPRADEQGAFQDSFTWPAKNYDPTHRLDPTSAGPHLVCGDTEALPGGPQEIAAKACAQFVVVTVPSASPSPQGGNAGTSQRASISELIIGVVILVGIVGAFVFWLRSRP